MNIKTLFIKRYWEKILNFICIESFCPIRKYYGLNKIDKKLLKYINYSNGFFIELGANDGLAQSNTIFFEKFRNWHGILIEPIPLKFHECKKIGVTKIILKILHVLVLIIQTRMLT